MAFKLPWSNFHELNLDWLLAKMKELEDKVNNIVGGATPATNTPNMDGVGSPGSSITYSRGDHTHPTDTSRASQTDMDAMALNVEEIDRELWAGIGDVDDKIKFSTAAPLVDGVANPGSSDAQARADHVHPTDTSRASKSEFDTLKATVDSFVGSAVPYDLAPEMDDVASAGSVGAYARGNHVHPKDSTKFDKAGGHITGAVINENLTGFMTVDAIGWLRVANVPAVNGTEVVINISRRGDNTPSESHKIVFAINSTTGAAFNYEESIGDVAYINSIRYTDAGFIDIHVDQTYLADVAVHIEKFAVTAQDLNDIGIISFAYVADAPDGETVITSYAFTENTSGIITVTNRGKTWTFMKRNGIASVASPNSVTEAIAAGTNTITTLPVGWRPKTYLRFPITNATSFNPDYLEIRPTGTVNYVHGAIAAGDPCTINGTWIIDF